MQGPGSADAAAAPAAPRDVCANPGCTKPSKYGARMTCTRCRAAQYCDAQCQRAHWRAHKPVCAAAAAAAAAAQLVPYDGLRKEAAALLRSLVAAAAVPGCRDLGTAYRATRTFVDNGEAHATAFSEAELESTARRTSTPPAAAMRAQRPSP